MNDYIAKPIKYSELLDVLARWLPAAGRGAELPSATEDGGPAESGPADSGKEGRREAEERSPAQDVEEAGEVATDVAVGVAAGQEVPRPLFDGIDMEEGLGRALGREALQLSLLGSFARTQAGTPGRLAAAIAAGDLKEAVMAVHTARGAAGNIAALDLHRAATELETALREGAGLGATAQVEVFLRELARVLAALAPLGEGSA
jgi:HPt (histidine-containing phosphotransfer) domain-containing protein